MTKIAELINFLSYEGLSHYDSKIKEVIASGDAANRKSIADLIGTLATGDASTIEEINNELNTIDAAIATLNGAATVAGSVAKSVKDGIDAIGTGTTQGTTGKALTSLTQTNGIVTATAGNINAEFVNVNWGSDNPVSNTGNVQAALNEIHLKLVDNAETSEVAVYNGTDKVSTIAADGTTYTFKQGNTTIATLNIARDMVVSSGSVITADGTETDVPTGTTLINGLKYVKLVLANSIDGKNIYIPVNELYDDYTFNDSDEIDFTELNNEVNAFIKVNSIAKNKLTTALLNEISAAATVVNEKSTGHVQVSVTPASGANPAQVTITEDDIASASALSSEITRAQGAESEISTKLGLTGVEGSRIYSTNVVLGNNVTKNVVNDINKLDARLIDVETSIDNIGTITNAQINNLFT